MKQMEQQNVKYDPQIRKLQKERYADHLPCPSGVSLPLQCSIG